MGFKFRNSEIYDSEFPFPHLYIITQLILRWEETDKNKEKNK